jgi:spore coat polysaccharide biosynthesis protein SpsF
MQPETSGTPGAMVLRAAASDDARLLFEWFNDADVRAMSFTSAEVNWPRHLAWLQNQLAAKSSARLWIADTADGQPLGQIRFDGDGGQAILSVSIDRHFRGQGYGSRLIAEGCRRVFRNAAVERIMAYVKPENLASQSALARAGFLPVESTTCRGEPAQAWCRARRIEP